MFNNNPTLTNTNNRQTKNISKTFGNETINGHYNSYGQSTSESFNGLTSEFTYTPAYESELSVKPDTIYDAYENSTIKYTYNADKELIRFEKFNGKNDFNQTQRKAFIAMNADKSFSYGKNHNAITTTKITRDSSKFINPRVNENEITLTNKTIKAAYLYDNYGRLSSSAKFSLALPNISRLDEALIYDNSTPAITRQELKNLSSVGKFRVDTDYNYNKGCLTSKNSQFWNSANSQINSFTHNHSYNYDAFNRIISEQTIDKNYIYAYNNEGNLSGISGSITRSFEHTDGRLTSINGTAVAYNDYGNPTSYKGNVINWTRGTLLKKYGSSAEYSYNLEGVRYQKTVNGIITSYDYDGHKLLREDRGGEDVLIYLYDATGIMGVMHRKNNIETVYYYLKDILGNIIGITLDDRIVAVYDYNAFGECIDIKAYDLSTMQPTTDLTHIAFINPFRWKSYYFDTETELYNIFSSYYDPYTGRFINTASPTQIFENAFEFGISPYSLPTMNPLIMPSNPHNYLSALPLVYEPKDYPRWQMPTWLRIAIGTISIVGAVVVSILTANPIPIIGVIAGGIIGSGFEMASQAIKYGKITDWEQVGWSAFGGASAGGIATMIPGAGYGMTFLLGGTGSVIGGIVSGNVNSLSSAALRFVIGGTLNVLGKWAGDKIANLVNRIISAKATDFVANKLFMEMMGSLGDNVGAAFANQTTQQVFNTAAKNILLANGYWMNSLAYIILNQTISSFISGWF